MAEELEKSGTVLYRFTGDEPEFGVIFRYEHKDWTLPKGHTESGESLREAAERETEEETGWTAELGELVGDKKYNHDNLDISVKYYLAEAEKRVSDPDHEVEEVRWVELQDALDLLTYENDKAILNRAYKKIKSE